MEQARFTVGPVPIYNFFDLTASNHRASGFTASSQLQGFTINGLRG
jgi:hypothetical protein